jgi:hypothetical protein
VRDASIGGDKVRGESCLEFHGAFRVRHGIAFRFGGGGQLRRRSRWNTGLQSGCIDRRNLCATSLLSLLSGLLLALSLLGGEVLLQLGDLASIRIV